MKVGLYFGSFNPVHIGHLIIASYMADHTDVDEVWFVVSPQNPFKNAAGLLNQHHRLSLVQIAIENVSKLKASNVEFKLPKPSYTIDTLTYLKEQHPTKTFSIIMGSDGFQNIDKWKNYQTILDNYSIYIYNRPRFAVTKYLSETIKIIDAPLLEISSTMIRKNIKQHKSIRFYVPDVVHDEIMEKGYYQSNLENPTE